MSLEQYCGGKRTIIQSSSASAYEAVRALEANHIGAIVVEDAGHLAGIVTDRDIARRVVGLELDPKHTRIRDVMTPEPTTVSIDDDDETAAKLMRARHVRRLPIMDGSRVVGIVTLDDLMMSGNVERTILAEIVEAQLAEPADAKPAGDAFPRRDEAEKQATRAARHAAHVQNTAQDFKRRLQSELGIDNAERAVRAFEVLLAALVRRITPSEARDLVSQLPWELRDRLLDLRAGPDRSITLASIYAEMSRRLDITRDQALAVVQRAARALPLFVGDGVVTRVRDQLPGDLKAILPASPSGLD